MKGKNIILVGTGAVVGFISCEIVTTKKLFENDRTREALVQIISDKIETFLFGEVHQRRNHSKVSYQSYYDSKSRPFLYDDLEDVIFSSRKDVEDLIDNMNQLIERYGVVTVADYYDLCGISKVTYKSSQYGWLNIDNAKSVRIRAGYKISLPRPLKLD